MSVAWLRTRLSVFAVLSILALAALFLQGFDLALDPALLSTSNDHHHELARSLIPPIVHFVQLKQDEAADLHFSFESFLALYAAHRSIQPSAIYIHTDFGPDAVASAIENGSSWTKKVLTSFPDLLHLNYVTAPTQANGIAIKRVEHRSDFVRLEQLARFGGVYLDWDVITLRPLKPLLEAGFRTVVGRQFDGFVNNGIILASANSGVVAIMRQETPRVFDGGWITHSVTLLTTVANRLASVPREVLIMDFKAFAPFGWSQASVDEELARHEGDAVVPAAEEEERALAGLAAHDAADAGTAWATGRHGTKKDWEYDFSDAYFLHKFYNDVEDPSGFEGVSVPYVLARDSNYALAAWPIVMQGIQDGFMDANDATL